MTSDDESQLSLPPHARGAQAAHATRFELGLAVAPISDLWDVVARRDVDLAFHRFGPGGGDGLYMWDGRRGLIVANSSKAAVPLRVRFTVAHELGHHEMHRSPGNRFLVADRDVESESSDFEREANAFAAVLLAPDRALQDDLRGRPPDSIEVVDVVRLMHRYGLSFAALLNRLNHAGCIRVLDRTRLKNEGVKGRVKELMSAIGFDPKKSFPVPGEQVPTDYLVGVTGLYTRGVLGSSRVAELLRLPESRARSLVESVGSSGSEPSPTHAELRELDALLRD